MEKTIHPKTCKGCRHSHVQAFQTHTGFAHTFGACLRPKGKGAWGNGCRDYTEAASSKQRIFIV